MAKAKTKKKSSRRKSTGNRGKCRGHNGGGNRTKVTAKKKEKFLDALIETGGNVTRAAELVNLPRKTLYAHRAKDKKFKEDWDRAVDKGVDVLEDEARRRAFEGVQEPVYQKGELKDYVTRYSDTLLIFLLKGHRAKYKERHEITGPDGQPLVPNAVNIYLPDNKRSEKT